MCTSAEITTKTTTTAMATATTLSQRIGDRLLSLGPTRRTMHSIRTYLLQALTDPAPVGPPACASPTDLGRGADCELYDVAPERGEISSPRPGRDREWPAGRREC